MLRIIFAFINKLRKKGAKSYYIYELKYKKLIEFYYQNKKAAKSVAIEFANMLDQWE